MPFIIIIILLIIIIALLVYILLIRKEQSHLAACLRDIGDMETNGLLWSGFSGEAMRRLVVEINQILERSKNDKLLLMRAQAVFKETITNVSHDLRTPLTSAKGYIQMLLTEDTAADKQIEYLRIVEAKLIYQQRLLDELFDFARMESGEYVLGKILVNVTAVLEDVLVLHYEESGSGRQAPVVDIPARPVYILGDPKALQRIFHNLLQNALTHGDGDLIVSLWNDNGKAKITICNACAVKPPDVSRLFERFYKGDNARTANTTGLGLAIAKELTEKMDGRIQARYEDGRLEIETVFITTKKEDR